MTQHINAIAGANDTAVDKWPCSTQSIALGEEGIVHNENDVVSQIGSEGMTEVVLVEIGMGTSGTSM